MRASLAKSVLIGSLLVVAFCLPVNTLFGDNIFKMTGGEALEGDRVLSQLLMDLDEDVEALSVAICFDGDFLEIPFILKDKEEVPLVELGADAAVSNDGSPPAFVGINENPTNGPGLTLGLVVNFGGGLFPSGTDLEILDITFDIVGGPDPEGEEECITTVIEFCVVGDPEVFNNFLIDKVEIDPDELQDGSWEICKPPEFDIELVCIGGLTDVELDFTLINEFAYFTINRDGELIDLFVGDDLCDDADKDGNRACSYIDEELDPGTYNYSIVGIAFPDGTAAPILISAECTADVIPLILADFDPEAGHYVGGTEVTLTGKGFEGGKDLIVEFGGVSAENISVLDDETLTCETPSVTTLGEVSVFIMNSLGEDTADENFLYGFVRGDMNENGDLSIGDTIAGLAYLFTGGDEPDCLDAVDANDDARLDLADPIYVARHLFDPENEPAPPEPFDLPGLDPTGDDDFGCLDSEGP